MNLCERCLGPEQAATIAFLLLIANVLSLERPLAAPDCTGHESLRALTVWPRKSCVYKSLMQRLFVTVCESLPPTAPRLNLCERLFSPNGSSTIYNPFTNHFLGSTC